MAVNSIKNAGHREISNLKLSGVVPKTCTLFKCVASMFILSMSVLSLTACDSQNQSQTRAQNDLENDLSKHHQGNAQIDPDILPFLNIQEKAAKYAVPFCEKSNCMDLDIQTIQTQDSWINQWIERSQAQVIQDQIGLSQVMTLQQAINAYVKKSDAWQDEFKKNQAFGLTLHTRIASQRNQYVLLQVIVHTKQQGITVKDRGYFFVADRKKKRQLSLLDVIRPDQQNALDAMIQMKYKVWLKEQARELKKIAPQKLYWGQSDWFFDQEGVGLHYRANEILKDGAQLDIYFSKKQTQQILRADVFEKMF